MTAGAQTADIQSPRVARSARHDAQAIDDAVPSVNGRPGGSDVLVGHDLDRILIRCDKPMPVQVDGEDLGDVTEAEIVAERDALTVLT